MSKADSKTQSKTESRTELPTAVYAAAGAGDLAYRKLRELRSNLSSTELRERAGALRGRAEVLRGRAEALRERVRTSDKDLAAGLALVRESAVHTATNLASRAVAAQEKAVTGYRSLVARGEQVVNDRLGETTGPAEPPVRAEIVVGDVDDDATAKPSTKAGHEGSRSTATGASRRTTNPNGRGAGKTGATPAGKRAAG